ncbi:Bcr/CflA family drug resistance efflux transporter [Shewanella sp. NFH-SH190041]|uniref:multidrug effflux MFS transporter n=1 Tax=Shewanella sp. NFH-SH190041 TaxID=2950245 RepID=UPI0021C349E7|nr:multidrug effflux MFS transporter [Shewanella sp. NFH-SH190041]BDM65958.1 Bcr/CflA family drug resistance efflux transporter [Shewanella sp. NFH-SH190041]
MRPGLLPLLMLMVLFSPLAIDIYLPSMPAMAKDFSVSASEVQSTIALFLFAMGVGQIVIGPLTDRFGRRPVVLAGVVLYTLSSALAALAQDFAVMQWARVLQGLAACASSIVVFSAVRDCYSPKESSKIYSYLNGAICVVPALAPTLGGLLALQFGWRSNFMFMSIFGLIMLLVITLRFQETRPADTDTSGPLYRWGRYRPVLANSHFMFYALTCMAAMGAILSYVSYSSVWLIDHLGMNELSFTALFGLNACINIAACFTAPQVIRRLGNRRTVMVAQGLMLVAGLLELALYYIAGHQGLIGALCYMLPMMLLCAGFALLLGPATSMALAPFGDRAGTAAAMLGCIQMSGASVMAALLQQTSLPAPEAVGLMMVIMAVIFLAIMMLKRFAHWHSEPSLN